MNELIKIYKNTNYVNLKNNEDIYFEKKSGCDGDSGTRIAAMLIGNACLFNL